MSGQLLSSKVVVVEEEPRVRGIPSAPTSVAGAVGVTGRGPVGRAVLINSFEEFRQRFGGFTKDSNLALAAMGFFENGGSQLWNVRPIHYTDVSDPPTTVRAPGYLTTHPARPRPPWSRVPSRLHSAETTGTRSCSRWAAAPTKRPCSTPCPPRSLSSDLSLCPGRRPDAHPPCAPTVALSRP